MLLHELRTPIEFRVVQTDACPQSAYTLHVGNWQGDYSPATLLIAIAGLITRHPRAFDQTGLVLNAELEAELDEDRRLGLE